MTAKTRANFKTDKNTTFADNTSGDISAADLRAEVDHLADSALFPEDTINAVQLQGSDIDSSVGTPSDGDILVYRDAGSDWVLEAKPAGGSNPALNDVTDVTITSVADNEVLAYDSTSGDWINQTPAEAGLAAASHTHASTDISDSTAAGRTLLTAANAAAQRTALNVEDGATADQSDAEIETAYNNQVGIVSQVDAEAGTSTTAERWTPQRVAQAIAALASPTMDWSTAVDNDIIPDGDGTRDLGSGALRFAVLHVDQIDLAGTTLDGTSIPLTDLINYEIDGGGSVITTGAKGFVGPMPFDCTITEVTMLADQTGSIVVDIWKDAYANYPPTDADSITASAVPTISSAVKSQDSTLTGWTTSVAEGDILRFNVDSVTSIERVTISLKVTL